MDAQDGKADSEEPICSICLSGAMAHLQVTVCNHQFCEPCLGRWLQTQQLCERGAGTCPVCRSTITEFLPLEFRSLVVDREAAQAAAILALIMGMVINNFARSLDHVPDDPLEREATLAGLAIEVVQFLRVRDTTDD